VFLPQAGCPHRCAFCDQSAVTGFGEAADAVSQLRVGLGTLAQRRSPGDGRREVAFYGGNFTGLSEREQNDLLAVVVPHLDSGLIHGVRISTRPDALDAQVIDRLASMGVDTVEIGAQSMDRDVLRLADRGHGPGHVCEAARIVKARGLALGIHLMAGLPGQSAQSAMRSAKEVAMLSPDFARVHPALVLRGSKLESMMRWGEYRPLSIEDAVEIGASMLASFECEGIRVIRLGVHTSEDLLAGNRVVAGPLHPSFRTLAEGRLFLRILEQATRRAGPMRPPVRLACNRTDRASVSGYRRENLAKIQRLLQTERFEIRTSDRVPRYHLDVEWNGDSMRMGPCAAVEGSDRILIQENGA